MYNFSLSERNKSYPIIYQHSPEGLVKQNRMLSAMLFAFLPGALPVQAAHHLPLCFSPWSSPCAGHTPPPSLLFCLELSLSGLHTTSLFAFLPGALPVRPAHHLHLHFENWHLYCILTDPQCCIHSHVRNSPVSAPTAASLHLAPLSPLSTGSPGRLRGSVYP